jgi:CBS domain-containing protein
VDFRENAMTVKAILDAKGSNVVSIEPTADLSTAAKLLAEHRIGAVLVYGPDRRIAGILSERDIVRALAARGTAALDEPVGQVMTRKVVTCTPSETVGDIMERMTQGKFRHVPVLEEGRLAGIVSIGDVVKFRLHEMEAESAALRDYIQTA